MIKRQKQKKQKKKKKKKEYYVFCVLQQTHGAWCACRSDALRRPLYRGVGSSLMGQVPTSLLVPLLILLHSLEPKVA